MNELTLNVSGHYEDADGVSADIEVSNLIRTLTTKKVLKTKQTVGIAEEALVIGDVESLGFLILVNRDVTNIVNVLSGTGGLVVGQMMPGDPYGPVKLGPDMQAPFVLALVAECEVDVFLVAV